MADNVHVSKSGRIDLRWSGLLSEEELMRHAGAVEKRIREFGKARVLIELDGFEGFSVKADWARVKWSLEHMADVDCVAIVGPEDVANALALVGVTTIDHAIEVFAPEDRAKAEAWVARFEKRKG